MRITPYRMLLAGILGFTPFLPAPGHAQSDCTLPAESCRAPHPALTSLVTAPALAGSEPVSAPDAPRAGLVGSGAAAEGTPSDSAATGVLLPAPTVSLSPTNQYSLSVSSWSATVGYSTPAYVSRDVPRSVSLFYASGVAKPLAFVQVEATDDATQTPTKMSLVVKTYNGTLVTENFYVGAHGTSRLSAQWDASALGTATYNYVVSVRSWWSDGTFSESTPQNVRVLVLNPNDAIAPGWTVVGAQHLYGQPTGGPAGVTIAHGDGTAAFFEKVCDPACHYISPANDFSTLVLNADNTFTRTYPDGSRTVFTPGGLISYSEDRFSSRTTWGWGWTAEPVSRPVPISVTDPVGKVTVLSYGDGVHLGTITDPAGRVSTVTYTSGDITQITAPDGVLALGVSYTNHRAISWWNRAWATTSAFYDYNNRLAVVFDQQVTLGDGSTVYPKHMITTFETAALPLQNLGGASTPSPRVDPLNLEMVVTDPKGNTTAMALTSTGNPWRIRDALGRTSYIGWNAASQPIRTLSFTGHAVSYYYTGMDLVKVWDETTGDSTRTEYGIYHQPTRIVHRTEEVLNTYNDTTGLLVTTRQAGRPATTFAYDGLGRVKVVTAPEGAVQTFTYGDPATSWDNLASVTSSAVGATTTRASIYVYDSYGRTTAVKLPSGDSVRTNYDVLNRVTSTRDAAGLTTTYENGALSVDAVVDAKGQRYVTHVNALGWVEYDIDPRGAYRYYGYDANGNRTSVRNRRAQTITFAYDALNRVTSRTADSLTTTWSYDPSGQWMQVQNANSLDYVSLDVAGRPTVSQVQRNGGTLGFTLANSYDAAGHRSQISATGPWVGTKSIGYHYDARGNLDLLTDLAGGQTTITSTEGGAPSRITLPNAGRVDWNYFSGTYPQDTQYNHPTAFNNALYQATNHRFTYNALGQVNTRRLGDSQYFTQYGFDKSARLNTITNYQDRDNNGPCPTDANGFLNCDYTLAPLFLSKQTLTYDNVGNPTDNGAVTQNGNRLTSYAGYTMEYDADGNMTRKYKSGYDQRLYWNSLGQLTQVTINGGSAINYYYDGVGRWSRRTSAGSDIQYVWDGDNLLFERDGSGNVTEYTYYPGVDRPHSIKRGSAIYYYLMDRPGNVTGLIDANHNLVNRYTYSPFGERGTVTEGVANAMQFQARHIEPGTHMYAWRARWYDYDLHRFVSEDPIGLAGGINPYAFVGNDPVDRVDPSGLMSAEPCTTESVVLASGERDPGCAVPVSLSYPGLSPAMVALLLRSAAAGGYRSVPGWLRGNPLSAMMNTLGDPYGLEFRNGRFHTTDGPDPTFRANCSWDAMKNNIRVGAITGATLGGIGGVIEGGAIGATGSGILGGAAGALLGLPLGPGAVVTAAMGAEGSGLAGGVAGAWLGGHVGIVSGGLLVAGGAIPGTLVACMWNQ